MTQFFFTCVFWVPPPPPQIRIRILIYADPKHCWKGNGMLLYYSVYFVYRCKLAAVYRLVDLHGWTQGIYNHITVS